MDNAPTLGKKLKMLRVGNSLTQDEMAEKLGISRQTYISYERDKAKPRREETYQKMAEILDCDVHELTDLLASPKQSASSDLLIAGSILLAGLAGAIVPGSLPIVTTAAAALSLINKKDREIDTAQKDGILEYNNTSKLLQQHEDRQTTFQAIAQFAINRKIKQDQIEYRNCSDNELEGPGSKPDESIHLLNSPFQSWWFSYWAKDPELDEYLKISADNRASILICRYTTAAFDPHRKVSIVVDDEELFNALIAYRDHNCYHGVMTAILIDTDHKRVNKEDTIADLEHA